MQEQDPHIPTSEAFSLHYASFPYMIYFSLHEYWPIPSGINK